MTSLPDKSTEKVEAFVARWQGQEGGQERANIPTLPVLRANLTITHSSAW
jgi:hypothetical protein